MPYTPRWNARFARPLLDQIIGLVQRDQAAAIAIVNPAISTVITQFHKGFAPRYQLPHFTIWAGRSPFDVADQLLRKSGNVITVTVDVGSYDQELAQELAWDWARIIDMILTTASSEDWWTPLPVTYFDQQNNPGMTTPPAQGALQQVVPLGITVSTASVAGLDKPVIRAEWIGRFDLEET